MRDVVRTMKVDYEHNTKQYNIINVVLYNMCSQNVTYIYYLYIELGYNNIIRLMSTN